MAANMGNFSGNIEGMIVDENGLDVLYWRNLESGKKKPGFKKQYYKGFRDDRKEEETGSVNGGGEVGPVKGLTLFPGRRNERIKNAPIVKSENQDSPVGVVKNATPPLPPPPGGLLPPPPGKVYASNAVSNRKVFTPPLPPPPASPLVGSRLLPSGSIPKGKMPAPPPPPPPMVSSNKTTAPTPPLPPPPPPPMVSSNKPPAPTPPLPPPPSKPSSSGEEKQVKMKALNWEKVNPDLKHSMVWDNIDRGSFQFDGDLMEALFGYVATNRSSPRKEPISVNTNKPNPSSQVFIFDSRKSQNIAIVIKSIGITRTDLVEALVEGHGLNTEEIEKFTKIAPNSEELSKLLAFRGDPTKLADAESFLYHLLQAVPSAFTRFNALLFKYTFDIEITCFRETLQTMESACKELKTKGLFLKLLEAVLKAGNRLNAGTSRGNAQAFNLTALTKLSDVKSSDGRTTLLQFVVQEVVRAEGKRFILNQSKISSQSIDQNMSKDDREREYMMLGLPVVAGLSNEFSNLKKAAFLDYDVVNKTSLSLSKDLDETRKSVEQCGNEGGFVREMIGFLDTAELDLQVLKEEQIRVLEMVKKTTDYYHTGLSSKGKNTFQLFVIVKDFLGLVDQVCVDISRKFQKKKPVSSLPSTSVHGSSSPPESPRVFRFPKLPVNFISEDSRNDSADWDSDS